VACRGRAAGMRDGYLRRSPPRTPKARQVDYLAAVVTAGRSVKDAAQLVGIRPSTAKRHLADLRARSRLSTEQLIYRGRPTGGSSSRRQALVAAQWTVTVAVMDGWIEQW
jgi:hypothetical protein